MRKSKFAVMLGAVALAMGTILGAAAPASAAAPSSCGAGSACVWSGYNYAVDWGTLPGSLGWEWCVDDFRDYFSINNKASSVYNNGNIETTYLYQYPNKQGARISILRGSGYTDLGKVSFNDKASSSYFTSGLSLTGTARCA